MDKVLEKVRRIYGVPKDVWHYVLYLAIPRLEWGKWRKDPHVSNTTWKWFLHYVDYGSAINTHRAYKYSIDIGMTVCVCMYCTKDMGFYISGVCDECKEALSKLPPLE